LKGVAPDLSNGETPGGNCTNLSAHPMTGQLTVSRLRPAVNKMSSDSQLTVVKTTLIFTSSRGIARISSKVSSISINEGASSELCSRCRNQHAKAMAKALFNSAQLIPKLRLSRFIIPQVRQHCPQQGRTLRSGSFVESEKYIFRAPS